MPFNHPNLEDHYRICSNVYGHSLDVPLSAHQDDEFLAAVRRGYDDASLHDCGHLVVDLATNSLAFLVTVRLEDDTELTTLTLCELSARYGVVVRLMAVPDGLSMPAYQLVTAQLDCTAQFSDAHNLVADIYAAEVSARKLAAPDATPDSKTLTALLVEKAKSDDGAAFRLANTLHISIQHEGKSNGQGCDRVFATPKGYGHLATEAVYADFGGDVDAATRLAISDAATALLRETTKDSE